MFIWELVKKRTSKELQSPRGAFHAKVMCVSPMSVAFIADAGSG